ncbi:TonB-dependent receptor domain-containing protein [Halomonas halocynthiae]|uniref:TonB-dependent receptor domain-containing protein n=1 Tax=Halomonas halocynthiae TaxID=176290 RepID=UPI0004008B1E|nr:TonB-dependent receptor [Halomonas halocynthiae]
MPLPRRSQLSTAIALASVCVLTTQTQHAHAQDTQVLNDIVVTAAGFEQAMSDAPASISVITREELEQRQASNLAEALRGVESVDVGGQVGKTGGRNISIRGMPSEYTLVLIDGRRQNAAGNVTPNGFGETSTSFFPPVSSIERIEVIRGPMSTLYGSDAMGGVINIITRKVGHEWTGSLQVENTINQHEEFGDSRALNIYTTGPLIKDTLGLQVRGRLFDRQASHLDYRGTDGELVEVSQRGPSPVEGRNYNVGARLTLTPDEINELTLDVDRSHQRYDNSDGQLGTLGARGYAETLRFERDQITLSHTANLELGTLDSSLMHNRTETLGRLIPPGTPGKVAKSERELTNDNMVFDTKLVMPLGDHMVSLGGQWWDASMTDGVATDKFEQTTWALFAEDEWWLLDNLALTLGGRFDHHDAFGSQFSPRGYLVWNATDQWTLKGGISRGYKTPRLDQLADGVNGFTGQGTIPTYGNPDLTPEKSTSSELAALYDSGNGLRAGATLFYNNFSDKIASGPDQLNCRYAENPNRPGCIDRGDWPLADTFGTSQNIDKAVTQGIELNASIDLTPSWQLSGNYTYTDSEQKSGQQKGEPLTDTPEHAANATLRWQTTDKLSTWLSAEYRSERYRNRERSRGAPSFADLGNFKSYSLFHLGGSYAVSENAKITATIYNLLDKDFVDYNAYDDGNKYGNVYANSEEGRRLWLSASYEF